MPDLSIVAYYPANDHFGSAGQPTGHRSCR
jgi:hypothetical protein